MGDKTDASKDSARSLKRTRNHPESSEQNDRNENQVELDESFDSLDEVAPRAKKKRISEERLGVPGPKLIEIIKGQGKQIPRFVKRWVERYEANPKPAMVELLLMLFEACGTKFPIEGNFVDEADVDDVVVALVNHAKNGNIEDCQASKKKELKNFKDNLLTFWDNLVAECQNGVLFDQILFEKCIDYIIALSCTPPRVYRQIASLVGLQLVTSFIGVAKMLAEQRETIQRQLNSEKKKNIDGPRVESLTKRLPITHEKIAYIESMIRQIFTGLFVHRYRDIDPNIRMSCIESLGIWILSYPTMFLQDLYLKYLGWTLNDKSAFVRKASIQALQNLYEVDDIVVSLNLFTERFANRMIELADDIDVSVAVSAIRLVKHLLRHGFLQDNDLGPLYDLLIDDPPEIRHAIGALVYDHLIAQKFNNPQSQNKDNGSHSSKIQLGRMMQILREFSTDPILSAYVIDDVWEFMSAMKDWKVMISILLDESPSADLTDMDFTNLVRLFGASVKKAVGDKIVPASDNRKHSYTKAQKEIFEDSRQEISRVMMKNYPHLLRKFMSDKDKIPSLVEIILSMDLKLYSAKMEGQKFKNVLQLIIEAFFKHGEKDALRSCVKAVVFCSHNSQGELRDFTQNKLKELEDELIAKLISAIKDVAAGGDEYSLLVNLKRLFELQLSKSVPIETLFEQFIRTLQNFRNMDDEVVSFLLLNMYTHVSWCLESVISAKTVSKESVSSLLSKRNALFEQLEYFLCNPPVDEQVKHGNLIARRVCSILTELWHLFRKDNFSSTVLECLIYSPDFQIVQKYWKLCEEQLNNPDDAEDEAANREYIEELNQDAIMFGAAKLVINDVVPKGYLGPQIISHFVKHGASVAEIVKHMISILKKKDEDIPNLFLEALKTAYHRYTVQSSIDSEESSKAFIECKDLATRLSASFAGASRAMQRSYVLKIVEDGIHFSFTDAPVRLSFLMGGVLPFVSKLPTPDILDIVKRVQQGTEKINTEEDPSGWQPYHIFVETLRAKYWKNEGLDEERENAGKKRGRPRRQNNTKKKKAYDGESSSDDVESVSDDDNMEEEDAPIVQSFRSSSSSKLRSMKVSNS